MKSLLNQKQIKKYIKDNYKKSVSNIFMNTLNEFVRKQLDKAGQVHNGGKKTIDINIAYFIGLNK